MARAVTDLTPAIAALETRGLLPVHDARLPSLTTLVAGEPVRGSWWGHPAGHRIFAVHTALDDHPDAVLVRLVAGKLTYVHRALWLPLLAVAAARSPWQLQGLDARARALFDRVLAEGSVRTDLLPGDKPGDTARALEARLLVHARQIHTSAGAHAKVLETWARWRRRATCRGRRPAESTGREALERAAAGLAPDQRRPKLPWDD